MKKKFLIFTIAFLTGMLFLIGCSGNQGKENISHYVMTSKKYSNSDGRKENLYFEYNEMGYTKRINYLDNSGLGWTEEIEYDEKGNLTKKTHESSDNISETTIIEYDEMNYPIKEYIESSSGYSQETLRVFNERGLTLLEDFKDSDGYTYTITNKYDEEGNQIYHYYKESGGYYEEIIISNDKNLYKESYKTSDGSYELKIVYNDKDQIIQEMLKSLDEGHYSYKIDFTYDKDDRLIKHIYKDSDNTTKIQEYSYAEQGTVKCLEQYSTEDGSEDYKKSTTYNELGLPIHEYYVAGNYSYTSRSEYNKDGGLTHFILEDSENVIMENTIEYDKEGYYKKTKQSYFEGENYNIFTNEFDTGFLIKEVVEGSNENTVIKHTYGIKLNNDQWYETKTELKTNDFSETIVYSYKPVYGESPVIYEYIGESKNINRPKNIQLSNIQLSKNKNLFINLPPRIQIKNLNLQYKK